MENTYSMAHLDTETIRSLWSNTYNREGKPDWSDIFPYYHEDILFKDSIQELRGIDAFKALCKRLTDRCEQLSMNVPSLVSDGSVIFMQWEMTMRFKKYPSSTIYWNRQSHHEPKNAPLLFRTGTTRVVPVLHIATLFGYHHVSQGYT